MNIYFYINMYLVFFKYVSIFNDFNKFLERYNTFKSLYEEKNRFKQKKYYLDVVKGRVLVGYSPIEEDYSGILGHFYNV